MLALVTLGFSKMVEESLSKMNSNLLNEGLIKTCGDAWWDDGRFDHERKDLQFCITDFIKWVQFGEEHFDNEQGVPNGMRVVGKGSWKEREVGKSEMKLERLKLESSDRSSPTALSNYTNPY